MKCLEKIMDFDTDIVRPFCNIGDVLMSINALQYLNLVLSRFFQIQTHVFSSSDKKICFRYTIEVLSTTTRIATYNIRYIIFNAESKKESFIYRNDIAQSKYYKVDCRTGLEIEISLADMTLKFEKYKEKTYVFQKMQLFSIFLSVKTLNYTSRTKLKKS